VTEKRAFHLSKSKRMGGLVCNNAGCTEDESTHSYGQDERAMSRDRDVNATTSAGGLLHQRFGHEEV